MSSRRFQFHLSTAIAMVVVAGALMWANFTPSYGPLVPSGRSDVQLKEESWGWPCAVYGRRMLISSAGTIGRPPAHWYGDPTFGIITGRNMNYDGILVNIFVAGAVLYGTFRAAEHLRKTKNV